MIKRLILLCLFLVGRLATAAPIIVFQDSFDAGALDQAWKISSSVNGRVTVSGAFAPNSGTGQLVLDDSVEDAQYSIAEATLTLDLAARKNVVLSFRAKSLGNEAHTPPAANFTTQRAFDGVSISVDGGVTWRSVASLANVDTNWQAFSVTLDSAVASLGGTFTSGFLLRFSEYDNAPAPIDGITIDDVVITADEDQRAILELPTASLLEGTGPYTGYILLAAPASADISFTLTASPAQLSLPASVSVTKGSTYASFDFSILNDSAVNLTRTVTITPVATGVTSVPGFIRVLDDDGPVLTLVLPPRVSEGGTASNNATLKIDRAASVSFVAQLSANPASQLVFPSALTVPAGATEVTFTVNALDDNAIDGDVPVTLTAAASGFVSVSGQVIAVDNEVRALSLTAASPVLEGGTLSGTITLSGTLSTPVQVTLTSGDPSILSTPATVTIPAGQLSATFTLTGVENATRDGTRSVTVTATADTFTPAALSVSVRDNEVGSYRFGTIAGIVNIGNPLAVTVNAVDVEGNTIPSISGAVNLSLVLPDGTTQAVTPTAVTLAGAVGWSGNVTLPIVGSAPLRLRATDAGGLSGDSAYFDIMRTLPITAADLIWDGLNNRIYASVPTSAGAPYGDKLLAINPATGSVVASVPTTQNPGKLALTSGSERLYVALNGNGNILPVTPSTLALGAAFAVGTDPNYGTLYAEDMATVAGQPNLIVVSQKRLSVSPRHNGVAVYDNGVMRSAKTQDHTGSNAIEPSADPTLFFGFCNESTEFGFRQVKLSATGMTELNVTTGLLSGFSNDIHAASNLVYDNNGTVVDGLNKRRLGTFGTTGRACPDSASSRVYFAESSVQFSSSLDRISAYDPNSFALVKRLTLPASADTVESFIRWGVNGLAYRTSNSIVLITTGQLIPSDPPADLNVTMQASPNPSQVNGLLTYTVTVTNNGPNPAPNSTLTATLSTAQTLQSATATLGTVSTSGSTVTANLGTVPNGATIVLTVKTVPQSAGSLTCTASATSTAVDIDPTNNTAFRLASVGFQLTQNVVNQLRLAANNLVYDSGRNVLWASIPSSVDAPLGRSVVSIDPTTGLISDPIPLKANPAQGAMALSVGGQYLYVGLTDSPEVHRIDLTSATYDSIRIPLGTSQWGDPNYAEDIEGLPGDGTSFLLASSTDHAAWAFDGITRRTGKTGIYTVDRVEKGSGSIGYIGYNSYTSGFELTDLLVNSIGVSVNRSLSNVISGYSVDIRTSGGLLLSSNGKLIDSSTLALKATLPAAGRPCIDSANREAFFVSGSSLLAYSAVDGHPLPQLALPTTQSGDWALSCLRWGTDGLAILGNDGKIYITRWSVVLDLNGDGIPDSWTQTYFNGATFDPRADDDNDGIANALEYLFATSPKDYNRNPVQFSILGPMGSVAASGAASGTSLQLVFPRRVGLPPNAYRYEIGSDLANWSVATGVTERVVSTQTSNGLTTETVEATMPAPSGNSAGFLRLVWHAP